MMPTIKELRKARKMRQYELAALTGLSQPVLVRMEKGRPIQLTSFKLVCQALGVNPEDVTGVIIHSGKAAASGEG